MGALLVAVSAVVGLTVAPAHAVVTGQDAPPGDFPYMVSVRGSSHECGGVIISDQWVLTAAQCVDGRSASDLSVRAGTDEHAAGGIDFTVTQVVKHPDYDSGSHDYDIGLIKISGEFALGIRNVDKVALPASDTQSATGTTATLIGWGATQEGGALSQRLQEASVPVVDHATCQKQYDGYNTVTDRMLCAGPTAGGVGSCTGDTGGPLLQNGVPIGLVSWANGCAKPTTPTSTPT
ncbi:serine protease [Streptomyces sp. NPDC050523]|uniref:serine protease n=1 Tax=Streptomyces sp. NPDC050523 TaxID=3365622 RepID=UPI0037B5D4C6